ncbi:putative bifunctional diguanylate cyclase/phosphodiesterase [Deinococcus aquaedulcis]|uniref:putative bifunctional diguanylate cyclase/phosphodiesterase n=1 Tax=Deinococcus aquaedulcis TaxID=2840455 RepID=UPI001C83F3A2|nr:EAL domain-containing protein [Deinococcus aquaedulcis]
MNRWRQPHLLFGALMASALLHAGWVATGAQPAALRPVLGNLIFFAPCLLAAALSWTLSRRVAGQTRRAWVLFTAGLLCWAAGQVAYAWLDLSGASPFPSLADVGYLLLAPCFFLGALHIWQPLPSRLLALGFVLDVALIVLALGTALWASSVAPVLTLYAGQPFALAVAMAYPLSDLVVVALALVAAVWQPRGLGQMQLVLLGSGLAVLCVAHTVYAQQAARGAYLLGAPLDLLWPLAFVAFGSAAYVHLVARDPQALSSMPLPLSAARRHRLNVLPSLALTLPYAVFFLGPGLQGGHALWRAAPLLLALLFVRQVLALVDTGRLHRTLERQARHDALTGLLNRSAVHEALTHCIQAAQAQGQVVGVMFLDLDRLKHINDAWGHAAGDQMLRQFAQRLRASTRAADIVGRFGGDEFVVVAIAQDQQRLQALAQRLLRGVRQPVELMGQHLELTASVGVAVCPSDAVDAATALHQADLAMYRAKAMGRNALAFYDARDHAAQLQQIQLEEELRAALASGALELHYQPIVALPGGELRGVEALLRWTSPSLGPVSPLKTVQLAEERGLMPQLGAWVLAEAVRQVGEWRRDAAPTLTVSVNVSASQFGLGDFVDGVVQTLARHGVPGEAVMLELTESTLIQDAQASAQKMRALRELGVRIALDDFGTGYSSLSYLRQLPVDVLKIDRSFVHTLNEGNDAFVRAIVTLGQAQGAQVVIEGIEAPAQAAAAAALGCELGQGYHFARPLSAAQLEARLSAPQWPPAEPPAQGEEGAQVPASS